MVLSAEVGTSEQVRPWRDLYRAEMNCQIVHDSIHDRVGWTHEYGLHQDGVMVGYGSVAVAGPWLERPTVYEFYLAPGARLRMLDQFRTLLEASAARMVAGQSNDPLLHVALQTFCRDVTIEKILFDNGQTTAYAPQGATFRTASARECPDTAPEQLRWRAVVEVAGEVAATGGVLFHYNRPYADIYMETAPAFRRRGYGTFLVQELKRLCYEAGHTPAARCSPENSASWRTLQRAGFVPCGALVVGTVMPERVGA